MVDIRQADRGDLPGNADWHHIKILFCELRWFTAGFTQFLTPLFGLHRVNFFLTICELPVNFRLL